MWLFTLNCNFCLASRPSLLMLSLTAFVEYIVIWRDSWGKELCGLPPTVSKKTRPSTWHSTRTWIPPTTKCAWKWPFPSWASDGPQAQTKPWLMLVRDSKAKDPAAPYSDSWLMRCSLFKTTAVLVFFFFTKIDKYYSGFLSQVRTLLLENHFSEKNMYFSLSHLCLGL